MAHGDPVTGGPLGQGNWGIRDVYSEQSLVIRQQFGAGARLLPRQWSAVANARGATAGARDRTNTAGCDAAFGSDAAGADTRRRSAHSRSGGHRHGPAAATPATGPSRGCGAGPRDAAAEARGGSASCADHNSAGRVAALCTAQHHHRRSDSADDRPRTSATSSSASLAPRRRPSRPAPAGRSCGA